MMTRSVRWMLLVGLVLPVFAAAQGETPVRIKDGSQAGEADVVNATPTTEYGLVVRFPSLPTGDNTVGRFKLTDGTDTAQVTATAGGSLQVECALGCGGGTQYAEDTAAAAGEQVTMAGVVRKDTAASLVDLDGDRTELQVDASGRLWVNGSGVTQPVSGTVTANAGTGTFTVGATDLDIRNLVPAQDEVGARLRGQRDDTTPGTIAEDAYGDARITTNRALHVNLRNDGGTELGTATTPIRMDPTGTTTQPVSGTVTANAGTGTFTVGQATASNLKAQVQGEAASGAAKAGNPVQAGGVFNTTQPTVTTGQAVELQATARGALIVAKGVDGFALDANQSVNVAQVAGGATATVATGTQKVGVADDAGNAIASATARPLDAARGLTVRQPIACTSFIAISQTADTQVVTGTAGQRIYICAIFLFGNAAETVNVVEGSGSVCATSPTAVIGSTTEANGVSLAANGGFVMAAAGPILRTAVDGNNLCVTQVGTSRVTGTISYVVAAND